MKLKMLILFLSLIVISKQEIINLSDYEYPQPERIFWKQNDYTIAILGTNDIHGGALSLETFNTFNNETYFYGGLEFLSTYIHNLRDVWGERLLWLDGGDQFQGTIENTISNGTILTDFYNHAKVDGSTIGNHEWDFGRDFLDKRLAAAKWQYLVSNVYNNKTKVRENLNNTVNSKIFNVGLVKIGVIGITTVETPFTTAHNFTNEYIIFKEYKPIIIEEAKKLREQGANAVLLNSHVGVKCLKEDESKIILKMRTKSTYQEPCESNTELYELLYNLPSRTLDGVVGGHMHDGVHHWINDVPVIQNPNGGRYFNIMYLTFNLRTKKFLSEKTKIEGPIPICGQILKTTKRCNPLNPKIDNMNTTVHNFIFHSKPIFADEDILKIFHKFDKEISYYKEKIAYSNVLLESSFQHETQLGNLVADFMRRKIGSPVAILNTGAFRTYWDIGYITLETVFNMLPFNGNFLVAFDMTGSELKRCMKILQEGRKKFYTTSGLYQRIKNGTLDTVMLYNRTPIIDTETYRIASINFLSGGGDDFAKVLEFYKLRNYEIINIPIRDIISDYLREMKVINENDSFDPMNPRLEVIK